MTTHQPEDTYIWVNRWEEFQTFQNKRGKPWAPEWIKLYPRLFDNDAFIELPENTRLLLIGLFVLFSRTRGELLVHTRSLSRRLNQRVTKQQLETLSHAGFIDFCSRTVLERRRNAFWNSSVLDVDIEVDREEIRTRAVKDPNYDDSTDDYYDHPVQTEQPQDHIQHITPTLKAIA